MAAVDRTGPWAPIVVVLIFGLLATACTRTESVVAPTPTSAPTTTTTEPPPAIPPLALDAYANVGRPCPGVDWALVAGIGKVESDHGRIFGGHIGADGTVTPPIFGPQLDGSGVGGNITPMPIDEWTGQYGLDGDWLRAIGPMQFLPESFERFGVDGDADGLTDPHNLYDAVASAANLLCSTANGESDPAVIVLAYNRSSTYRDQVLDWADRYRRGRLQLA